MLKNARRLKAAGIHLLVSIGIAVLAGATIFFLWYSPPFDVIAGGTSLFLLVMTVDVVLGPALTLVAASPGKPANELRRDLLVIATLQIAALGYGLYTVSLARPVLVSFEVDRLRVVSAAEIDPATLAQAPEGLRSLSWTGPRTIAAVKPQSADEAFRSVQLGMAGLDLSMDPRQWRPYEAHVGEAWQAARPIERLVARYPATTVEIAKIGAAANTPSSALRFLPLQSRRASWVAVMAPPGARIVGYLAVEGFF